MAEVITTLPRRYVDSILLLALTATMADIDDVDAAIAVLGTPDGVQQAVALNFLLPTIGPNDLVLCVRGTATACEQAIERARAELDAGRAVASGTTTAFERPRTIDQFTTRGGTADIAVISVPGRFAASTARRALDRDMHCFIFSDNVSVDDEVALKIIAAERGLLVMGPDCGTSISDGVRLGFANVVRRGSIAVVGASGTGMQEITTIIHRAGGGISQAIGCGGRDLSDRVGARTMVSALALLENDEATKCVVLVSKPPAGSSVEALRPVTQRFVSRGIPVIAAFVGLTDHTDLTHLMFAPSLADAAIEAVRAVGITPVIAAATASPSRLNVPRTQIYGAFCGGTFAAECRALLQSYGPRFHVTDFGDDAYTVGRPHPMIDPSQRDQHVAIALRDAETAVVLIDVVLGQGAASDPIRGLLPVIGDARAGGPVVVANVCGTDLDVPSRASIVSSLLAAGVIVAESNARAARLVAALVPA